MISNDRLVESCVNEKLQPSGRQKNIHDAGNNNQATFLMRKFRKHIQSGLDVKSFQRVQLQNLLSAVENYPFSHPKASIILSSITTFLQTSSLNTILIADIDKLISLLISTLKIICEIYKSKNDDVQSLKYAKSLLSIIFDILENLPSSNEEEKVSLFADHLQDLALFMHIAENDKELEHLSEKLAKKIISIVFNLKRKHFETLLTTSELSTQMEMPNPYLSQFFYCLQDLLFDKTIIFNSISVSTCCGTLIKKLLSTFLIQNKSSPHSFKVASLFFAVAGLDIPIVFESKSCCYSLFKDRKSDSDMFLPRISDLLESCSTVPQCLTSISVPEKYFEPTVWLKVVASTLLNIKTSKHKASWLKCFHSLFMISPSIMEDDILILIQNAFLNISVHSTESKKQYCELFDLVLQTHSKLHRVSKFIVKILLALTECIKENTAGNLLENGQMLPQVQESFAKCVQELPYGEMVELWKIFIETYSTLENLSKVFMVKKGYMFFVAQLFSTFLLHAQLFKTNIPTNVHSQFITLIENTCAEIKKIASSLKETDIKFAPSQKSILLMCYAIGEVKLAYNAYYGKPSDKPETVMNEEIFDFSALHEYLDKDCSSILERFMESDDKILSSLVFQLLLQKIKALQFKEPLSDEDISHMRKCFMVTLKYLQQNSACDSWDMDFYTINEQNYSTAYWMMFLRIFPLFLKHLSSRDLYSFCNTAQDIILQDDSSETGAKSLILAAFKNEFFHESKHFQTAFVSAVWKQENLISSKKRSFEDMETEQSSINKIFSLLNAYHSKALKYSERTPKSNKSLGSIWNEIKEISDLLNGILSQESLPKIKLTVSRTKAVIKLFKCLPLEYLLPGNQMKCMIGLSLLLFLIPQSFTSEEVVLVSEEISQVLISIFKGVRSIWLFDFVSSGSYLKHIVKILESINIVEYNSDNWAVQLILKVVSHLIINNDSLEAVEPYILELAGKEKCSTAVHLTVYTLLKNLSQVLSRFHKQEKYKVTVVRISLITVRNVLRQIKMNFRDVESSDCSHFIKCYLQAIEIICRSAELEEVGKDCFELLPLFLEKILNVVRSTNVAELSDLCLLFISRVCKFSEKLSAFLPEDFIPVSWKILLSHLEEKQNKKIRNLRDTGVETSKVLDSSFCELCSFISSKMSIPENGNNMQHVKSCNDENALFPLAINEFEEESLKILSMISTPEALAEVLHNLLKDMGVNGKEKNVFLMQMTILIFQCIIDVNNDKCQQPLFNKHIQEFLIYLLVMANQACNSVVCQIMVKIPIVRFINFMMKGNKGLKKEMLLQSLHCVVPVSLEVCENNYELFAKSFNAVSDVLHNLFFYHTPIVLGVPGLFLVYVKKLLKSIVKAGAAEPLSRCATNTLQQVQLCAQNMTRLLTAIAKEKEQFSKLVPYLVTYYVDTVQHITLNSSIKEFILLGIYQLLDICSANSIKMQAVNIDSMSREIYENLVKTYRQNMYKEKTLSFFS